MSNKANHAIKWKPKKNPWLTTLKVVAWCVGILILFAGIVIWIIADYYSPARIKDLIEKESDKYLNAEINIGRLEYKLFSTYPWLYFEVDTLNIVSKSLDGISIQEKAQLPDYADSLFSVDKITGMVNIHDLIHHKLALKDINISKPSVNIVMVNDSVTNFNIAPKMPEIKKMPEVDITEINVEAPLDLNFFSLQQEAKANVNVENFFLINHGDKKYEIGFDGSADGVYKQFSLPQRVPLKFKTGIMFDLPNFTAKMDNLSCSLAGASLDAKGEIIASKNGIDFQNADFKIWIDDIFTLLQTLPSDIIDMIPLPEGITGVLPLGITAHLEEPFHIYPEGFDLPGCQDLPEILATVTVEDANLIYHPRGGKKIVANDIYIEVSGHYNPHNTEATSIYVKEIRMHGEGISLKGHAHVDNLTGETQNFEGDFSFKSPLMETLSYLLPNSSMKIAGYLKGDIEFKGYANNLGKDGVKNLALSGDVESTSLKVTAASLGNLRLKNFKGDYQARIPSYPLTDYSGTKLDMDLTADSVALKNSDTNLLLAALAMKLDAIDTVKGNPNPNGSLTLNLGSLNLSQGTTGFIADNIALYASGALNSTTPPSYSTVPSYNPGNDSIIFSRVDHTPSTLVYGGGGMIQTLMTMVNLNADFSLGKAKFKSPDYLFPVEVEGLKVSTDLDHAGFSASDIVIARSSCSITGDAYGLKPFITSNEATRLKASALIDFNNVDINQLSWGYYGAMTALGKDSVFYVPPMLPFTAADSVCVLIPRNIDADIKLNSNSAEYMQYKFAPLSTDIIVKDGAATLQALTVGTPYCTAIVDWTYSTSQLDNIFMDLNAKVENFSFSPFYNVFPSLTQKAPEIENLTGEINAQIGCYFNMFPDMFMNEESLKGHFDIKGSNMEFARKGKRQTITHLMLIEGNHPIKIQNINLDGDFHNNILQLNPFKLAFDDYQLGLAGVNNTAGDLYYHIALEKSPFHMPFGVSIFGKMKHPQFRLGGTAIDDYRSEMVTTNPDTKINANIMAYLKHGWLLFVQEAAKYEGGIK